MITLARLKLVLWLHGLTSRLVCRYSPEYNARRWSNAQLRRFALLFDGDIINVSGWRDSDKEGRRYRDYFAGARSYVISNIPGARGATGAAQELLLDLTKDIAPDLCGRFDVVFNHTTLEHIFPIREAMKNLCCLSRDIVIVVVPFMQPVHYDDGSYLDYWRPTPFALKEMFRENGFTTLYSVQGDSPLRTVYVFTVASCHPDRWQGRFRASP